jgi:Zn-dependent protease
VAQSPALRFDYFTSDANEVAAYAYDIARLYGHQAVDVEHFALALLEKPGRILPKLLSNLELDTKAVSDKLDTLVQALPVQPAESPDKIYITLRTQGIIDVAGDESHQLHEDKIDNVHLLLAIVAASESPAAQVLTEAGLNRKRLLQAYQRSSLYSPQPVPASIPAPVFKVGPRPSPQPEPNRTQDFRTSFGNAMSNLSETLSRIPGVELKILPVTISPVFISTFAFMAVMGLFTFFLSGIPAQVTLILFVVTGWFVTLALHEFGHALAAYQGGDWSVTGTAYFNLNPFKYTHIWLSFVLPAVFFLVGGIGLPGPAGAFVGFHNISNKRQRSLAWAGGPIASGLCGLVFALPFLLRIVNLIPGDHSAFWGGLTTLVVLQFTSMLFTLIPLPGLDGFGILEPYLPERVLYYASLIQPYSFIIFLVLFLFPTPVRQLFNYILAAILWVVGVNPFPPAFGIGLLR